MKNVINFLILFCICFSNACNRHVDREDCHFTIAFVNNSRKSVYVRQAGYSDTLYIKDFSYTPKAPNNMYKVIEGQINTKVLKLRRCYEADFQYGDLKRLMIFVFDAEIVENTPWEIVSKDYLVLKRYDVTLEDLQRLDWKITYPPTEAMKDMKMWPPYGSE